MSWQTRITRIEHTQPLSMPSPESVSAALAAMDATIGGPLRVGKRPVGKRKLAATYQDQPPPQVVAERIEGSE